MKKIFTKDVINDKCVLKDENHNHVAFSLRSRVGDKLILCDEQYDYECVITAITKKETQLSVMSKSPCTGEPDVKVTLYFAIMKGDRNEFVAQKSTELGVYELKPFVSNNCECRVESFKTERLNKIITEAAQQCGRSRLPLIESVMSFEDVIDELKNYDVVIFPYERAQLCPAKNAIKNVLPGKKVALIVGSEGGFTKEEAQTIESKNVSPITLGQRILRAETASIAVLSAIMYEGEQWKINQK